MRTLLKIALVTLVIGPASSLLAEQKFCGDSLVVNSYYSNVKSNGSTAEVEYHVQLQNMDKDKRNLSAFMRKVYEVATYRASRQLIKFDLKPNEQKDLMVFALKVNNPGGSGAPTAGQVASMLGFTCQFTK